MIRIVVVTVLSLVLTSAFVALLSHGADAPANATKLAYPNISSSGILNKSRELYQMQNQKYIAKHRLQILHPDSYRHYLDHLIKHRRMNDIENVEKINPDLDSELDYWNYITENAPFFDTQDKVLERAFYFRLFTYLRHIKKRKNIVNPQPHTAKYVISEFLNTVPWEGLDGTISCGAGHHFREGRWLNVQPVMESYAEFWFQSNGGNPRQYSFWVADSILSLCKITGNFQLAVKLLPGLMANYLAIEVTNFNATLGLFYNTDNRDGMEWSISHLPETGAGARGYRPTLNSYMFGEAMAISKIALLAGNTEKAQQFREKARKLKENINEKLWDKNSSFYKVLGYKRGTLSDAREIHGYTPWYMNMLRSYNISEANAFKFKNTDYSLIFSKEVARQRQIDSFVLEKLQSWRELIDPQGFQCTIGLTSAEQRHKLFRAEYSNKHECQWNGPVWPYSTSITLTAMINAMNQFESIQRRHDIRFKYLKLLTSLIFNESAWYSHFDNSIGNQSSITLSKLQTKVEHLYSDESIMKTMIEQVGNYLNSWRYYKEIKKYAASHKRKAEKTNTFISWIDENLHPTTGDWISRTILSKWENNTWSSKKGGKERGKDYNHSTFIDLIISGLFGFRAMGSKVFALRLRVPPGLWNCFAIDQLRYRGHIITFFWDSDGKRYHRGEGFTVMVDGQVHFHSKEYPTGNIIINFANTNATSI